MNVLCIALFYLHQDKKKLPKLVKAARLGRHCRAVPQPSGAWLARAAGRDSSAALAHQTISI